MIDKRTQEEFCRDLMRRAPRNSHEEDAFATAHHYYQLARFEPHANEAKKYRMRASRAYKKGMALKETRQQEETNLAFAY